MKLHAHIEIASGTGMRPTDLKNLNWGHVVGFRSVRQGKLEDQDVRFQVQGKGKHGAVVPQLSVIPWLHALWDAFEREVGREPRDDDPVFSDRNGQRTSIAMIDKYYGQVSTERRKDQLRPYHKEW